MLPDLRNPMLSELSQRIFVEAGALSSAVSNATVRESIASLVREMNSYYSNLIEGHKTLPRDIVGLKPSAARQVIALGLREELLKSPSPKGILNIAFPAKVLEPYFPRLFLDLH